MNILVTGCSRGVGLEICRILLEERHVVYGVSRSCSNESRVLEEKYESKLFFKGVDLSDTTNIHKIIFKEFLTSSVPLDGYVNNAAVTYDDIITNLQIDGLRVVYNVNVLFPTLLTKYAIRNMLLHHIQGSIIHISSISVHTGYKGLSMYASSKEVLGAFSKDAAREWGQLGIHSNMVVPGFMETAMSSSLTEEQKDRIYKRISLRRVTDIRSVAETVAFLLSRRACSITGQNMSVDNGTIQ